VSVLDARLDRLMPTLKAKERALLVLGSLKDGTPEDPRWRQTMPTNQYAEFNLYIGLMNACNNLRHDPAGPKETRVSGCEDSRSRPSRRSSG